MYTKKEAKKCNFQRRMQSAGSFGLKIHQIKSAWIENMLTVMASALTIICAYFHSKLLHLEFLINCIFVSDGIVNIDKDEHYSVSRKNYLSAYTNYV